jgi:hypothetical protein
MKKLMLISVVLLVLVLFSVAFVSAATPPKPLNGKGAVFQYVASGHIINAYVVMSDSGKNGIMYVSIQHQVRGVSAAQGDVVFKWNMNHITAEAMNLDFKLTGDTTTGFTGKHNITITWAANGDAILGQSTVTTGHGLIFSMNGQYKSAEAVMDISDLNNGGHTHLGPYDSTWASVFQGNGQLLLTMSSS